MRRAGSFNRPLPSFLGLAYWDSTFGFEVVAQCPNVPKEILIPEEGWKDSSAYQTTAQKLAGLFVKNFAQYENGVSDAVRAAGPKT